MSNAGPGAALVGGSLRTVQVSRVDRPSQSVGEASPYENKIEAEAPVAVEVTASLVEFIGHKGSER